MTAFTGKHFEGLQRALVEAFPTVHRLEELTLAGIDYSLARITTRSGLDAQVFDLVEFAQSRGKLDELIRGAHEQNPTSPHLLAFLNRLEPGWSFNLPDGQLDARSLPPGHVIAGWTILRRLGAGGMGTVYAVSRRGAPLALKVLHGRAEEAIHTGFHAEVDLAAKLMEGLTGDGIVRVLEGNVDIQLKAPWILMDLLKGESLRARVRQTGRLSPRDTLGLAMQLFDMLADAHRHVGVIHCDIKPENLFLEPTRRPPPRLKLLDFGIARLSRGKSHEHEGPAYGTPLYAAPELWESAAVSPATDLWSCGLVVFYMLVGAEFWRSAYADRLAFEATVLDAPPASRRARELGVLLPESFDPWFAECLKRAKEQRFQSAEDAWERLEAIVARWPDQDRPLPDAPVVTAREPEVVVAAPEGANIPSAEEHTTLTAWLRAKGPMGHGDVGRVTADLVAPMAVLRAARRRMHGTLEPDRTQRKDFKQLEQNFHTMLRRVAGLNNRDLEFNLLHNLGVIYRDRLGQADAAIKAFAMASEHRPEDVREHKTLAELYAAQIIPTTSEISAVFQGALKLVKTDLDVPPEALVVAQQLAPLVTQDALVAEGLRKAVSIFLDQGHAANIKKWCQSVELTAVRAGFLMCADLEVARKMLQLEQTAPDDLTPAEMFKDVVLFSISEAYFSLREALGINFQSAAGY
jgi:serine/threonine-protein kinase